MESMSDFMSRKSGSFSNLMGRKSEMYLPAPNQQKPKFKVKALLGHCLYRLPVLPSSQCHVKYPGPTSDP